MKEIVIRKAPPEEVPLFIEWAGKEGWNPGIHDSECHYAVDPDGWFVAVSEDAIIGTIALTNYDDYFSFGGFFIVKEEFRHKGAGRELWSTASSHVGDRNLGIDGVYEMQDNYSRHSGFRFAYRNIRWEGTAYGSPQEDLIDINSIPFKETADYDSLHFPARRESFLKKWLNMPDSTALAYAGPDGGIAGYGVIRKCLKGHKIGPLFADSPEIADRILEGLTFSVRGDTFYFDTPEINQKTVKMAKQRDMSEVFGTARMYTGDIPELPVERIFGVTTFELG
jgi:GNAT superfamily N-acetyltransferase